MNKKSRLKWKFEMKVRLKLKCVSEQKFSAEMKVLVWTESFSADKKTKCVNENKIVG